ncbi:MAG: electron transport complex subunit RsxC, partial [Candidatus Omnitrophota bacterium]|nr:electron transport complex subunit RsxC [Candidatus Omnitrophota bacterium]
MFKSKPRGVHLRYYKELTELKPIKDALLPQEVVIALSQHAGTPARPIVGPGDKVKCGTKIAESAGLVSSPIHASISGVVTGVKDYFHPIGGFYGAVIISSDGYDEKEFFSPADPKGFSSKELQKIIHEAGVVGLGGAAFPTAVKINPP